MQSEAARDRTTNHHLFSLARRLGCCSFGIHGQKTLQSPVFIRCVEVSLTWLVLRGETLLHKLSYVFLTPAGENQLDNFYKKCFSIYYGIL